MSLRIEYEPRLIEEAVFLAMRDPIAASVSAAYRQSLDRLYALPPGEARESAFAEFHLGMFERLGFRRNIDGVLRLFPRLTSGADRLVLACAARLRDQDSELFRNSSNVVTILLRVSPQTLLSQAEFERFAVHELCYADDMLDPGFCYTPDLGAAELAPWNANALRTYYRALWDLCIDSRIGRMGRPPRQPRMWHLAEFLRLFGDSISMRLSFKHLWSGGGDGRLTHPALLEAARNPESLERLAGVAILEDCAAASP